MRAEITKRNGPIILMPGSGADDERINHGSIAFLFPNNEVLVMDGCASVSGDYGLDDLTNQSDRLKFVAKDKDWVAKTRLIPRPNV